MLQEKVLVKEKWESLYLRLCERSVSSQALSLLEGKLV